MSDRETAQHTHTSGRKEKAKETTCTESMGALLPSILLQDKSLHSATNCEYVSFASAFASFHATKLVRRASTWSSSHSRLLLPAKLAQRRDEGRRRSQLHELRIRQGH
jgi:hypothetical protein